MQAASRLDVFSVLQIRRMNELVQQKIHSFCSNFIFLINSNFAIKDILANKVANTPNFSHFIHWDKREQAFS